MGAYLSAPITEKEKFEGKGSGLRYGGCGMQGWRRTMEDAHIADTTVLAEGGHEKPAQVFGVFDGHGGSEVAKFCQLYLPKELSKLDSFRRGSFETALVDVFHRMDEMLADQNHLPELQKLKSKDNEAEGEDGEEDGEDGVARHPLEMLKKMLVLKQYMADGTPPETEEAAESGEAMDTDDDCSASESKIQAGCTAVVALVHEGKILVANAGDSRAVLCRDGKAVALSTDHKPAQDSEKARIEAAGGFLSEIGGVCRVNGNLNLSRAIGDLKYKCNTELARKDQIITAQPDVLAEAIGPGDEFLILACDGIWDVMSNQDAVDFVKERIGKPECSLADIAGELVDHCLAGDPKESRGIGCDNMTALIVQLNL
uniref:protein-serine/threonine phosphatase n=1 Tax=Tetraselmis sp. GSL018 TaxID=582737 RepID=A0A061S238_9CHLO|mmetsp:Transcript_9563/g.23006  ORF Transcript_9563/g.23006 Transcript_9563/m.23006 type:complete len:371 (+) Transcript_9563:405-1517(+)